MAGLGSRAGAGGQIDREKLEILWGSRGPESQWALRRGAILDVQKTIGELKSAVQSLKDALQRIKDDIDDINAQISDLENRLNSLELDISNLESRLAAAESSLTQLEADIANINSDIVQLQIDVTNLQADLSALTLRVTTAEVNITQLEFDVNELELGLPSLAITADLNTAVRNKEFQWSNTSTNTPVAGSYGRGWTIASSANDLTQFGVINTTGQEYVRFRTGGSWSAWRNIDAMYAAPFADQVNPGTTTFPAGAYTPIPFFTNNELSGGITLTSNTTFTVPEAGIYLFELGIRVIGGGAGQPPAGTLLGLSTDGTTTPTSLRTGYSASGVVSTGAGSTTLIRLVCMERLTAGAQRKVYFYNSGSASYQLENAGIKITRLSA